MEPAVVTIHAAGGANRATCVGLGLGSRQVILDVGAHSDPAFPPPDLPEGQADLALVTHAHIGHGGGLLWAAQAWQTCDFYAASPTFQILDLQFRHAGSHFNFQPGRTLIGRERVHEIPFLQPARLPGDGDGLAVNFIPCGHMPGASVPIIHWKGRKIAYLADWTAEGYAGSPGLDPAALSACDLLLAQVPDLQPGSGLGRALNGFLEPGTGAKVLIAVQPVGVLQEVLLELLESIGLPGGWELMIDPFSFAVCQACPGLEGVLHKFAWQKETQPDSAWFRLESGPRPPRTIYLCGTAGLWGGSPSNRVAKALAADPQATILLSADVLDDSPAARLKRWANAPAEGWHSASLGQEFGSSPIRARVETIFLPARKSSPADLMQLIARVRPRQMVLFGDKKSVGELEDSNPPTQYLSTGSKASFHLR